MYQKLALLFANAFCTSITSIPKTSGHSQRSEDCDNQHGDKCVRVRLYCTDGTNFDQPHGATDTQLPNLAFDSVAALEESAICGKRKRMNKSARARERKRLKHLAAIDFDTYHQGEDSKSVAASGWKVKSFDYVLVDAECSTDGSLKHIQKQIAKQSTSLTPAKDVAPKLMDSSQLTELVQLQKNLAAAGFRLLKEGGSMVYSTCSLSEDQNEKVVAWILDEFPEAFITTVSFSSAMPNNRATLQPQISEGRFGVRFYPDLPVLSQDSPDAGDVSLDCADRRGKSLQLFGGGFFLAKIGKACKKGSNVCDQKNAGATQQLAR
jgi:hypothetical protein